MDLAIVGHLGKLAKLNIPGYVAACPPGKVDHTHIDDSSVSNLDLGETQRRCRPWLRSL
jgi:hypothetical protein